MNGIPEILAWLAGATLSSGLVCAVWAFIFKIAKLGGRIVAVPLLGYVTTAILSSIGAANGGEIDWGYGFGERLIPAFLVGTIYAVIVWTKSKRSRPSSETNR